jgi:hypothetical protein
VRFRAFADDRIVAEKYIILHGHHRREGTPYIDIYALTRVSLPARLDKPDKHEPAYRIFDDETLRSSTLLFLRAHPVRPSRLCRMAKER